MGKLIMSYSVKDVKDVKDVFIFMPYPIKAFTQNITCIKDVKGGRGYIYRNPSHPSHPSQSATWAGGPKRRVIMARNNKKRKDNYRVKLDRAAADGRLQVQPGTVSILNVRHDDWCSIFKGGACNCNPDIVQEFNPICNATGA